MRSRNVAFFLVAFLAPLAAVAAVPELAVTIARTPDLEPTTVLHRVNLNTGELTPIGDSPVSAAALAFNHQGELFGVNTQENVILRFDISTGEAETFSVLNLDLQETPSVDLAFTNDGRLWMVAYIDDAHVLFEVNPGTGNVEEIAEVEARYGGGLAAVGNTLYAMGHDLAILDRDTGEQAAAGPPQGAAYTSIGLAANRQGKLWSLHLCNICMTPFDVIVLTVTDSATGHTTFTELGMLSCMQGIAIRPWLRSRALLRAEVFD